MMSDWGDTGSGGGYSVEPPPEKVTLACRRCHGPQTYHLVKVERRQIHEYACEGCDLREKLTLHFARDLPRPA